MPLSQGLVHYLYSDFYLMIRQETQTEKTLNNKIRI